jgi:hypothetical protein
VEARHFTHVASLRTLLVEQGRYFIGQPHLADKLRCGLSTGRTRRDRARGIDREPGDQSADVQEAADALDAAPRAQYLLHARPAMIDGDLGGYTGVGR